MPKVAIIGGLFGVIILGAILCLSMGFEQCKCDVCVTLKGRSQCRAASGADRKTALLAAHDNACAFLVASKTDGFLCSQTHPAKVECSAP